MKSLVTNELSRFKFRKNFTWEDTTFLKDYYGYIILEFIPFKIISSVDHLSGGEKISCLKLSGNKGTCLHCTVENKFPDLEFLNIWNFFASLQII